MCEDLVGELVKGKYVDPVTRLPDKEFYKRFLSNINDGEPLKIIEVHVELKDVDPTMKDIAISRIASVIKHSVRIPKDIAIRVGDKDFTVVLGDIDDNLAGIIAKRLKDNLLYFNLNIGGKMAKIIPTVEVKDIEEISK